MGLFRKETASESIMMLESMHLDGKEKLIEALKGMLSQQDLSNDTEVVGGQNSDGGVPGVERA